jgi:hypothetical protein
MPIDTRITTDLVDPKRSFDEIALGRCCAMALASLNPEEFDLFVRVHNVLVERRGLGNALIDPVD